eukprot:Pgem_evm1s6479
METNNNITMTAPSEPLQMKKIGPFDMKNVTEHIKVIEKKDYLVSVEQLGEDLFSEWEVFEKKELEDYSFTNEEQSCDDSDEEEQSILRRKNEANASNKARAILGVRPNMPLKASKLLDIPVTTNYLYDKDNNNNNHHHHHRHTNGDENDNSNYGRERLGSINSRILNKKILGMRKRVSSKSGKYKIKVKDNIQNLNLNNTMSNKSMKEDSFDRSKISEKRYSHTVPKVGLDENDYEDDDDNENDDVD